MKTMILTTLLLAFQSLAFGSQIKLTGEAGKAVCDLLKTTKLAELMNSSRHMDQGHVFEDLQGNLVFYDVNKKASVVCTGGVALVNGDISNVQ